MTSIAAALPKIRPYRPGPLRRIEIRWGYLFLSPWLIGFVLFTAGPMLFSLYLSFTNYDLLNGNIPTWIGPKNYTDVLGLEIKGLQTPDQNGAEVLDHGYAELFRIGKVEVGA